MKLQNLTVIFVIIVVPLSLILSTYVQTQIDTIMLQSSYNTKLANATYDAIKAFQLNTLNSNYSSVSDSKIRDIEASINTFFNTLTTNLGLSGYKQSTLKPYIPALVYTLYDGYYIYSPYENTETGSYMHGLKPYIYYTCRYIKGGIDIVVNYTLDNYIIIYGTIPGLGYVTRAGYLINMAQTSEDGTKYKGINIEAENLYENILISGEGVKEYRYVYSNGEKIYQNSDGTWFRYVTTNYTKVTVNSPPSVQDTSAITYYKEAYEFTEWVNRYLNGIQAKDALNVYKLGTNDNLFEGNNSNIFLINNSNDPDDASSDFNEHRREIIKNSIQTNLNTAMAGYNKNSQALGTTYDFKMPVISEVEWDKILNNICIISFLQGLSIGYKIYNSYCIIPNNVNKEFVGKEAIELINNNMHHEIGCQEVFNNGGSVVGYLNTDFIRQTVEIDSVYQYYYPHSQSKCYYCKVDSKSTYDVKDIINGSYIDGNSEVQTINNNTKVVQAFYHAFAREKYNLYKINSYLEKYKL